MSSVYDEIQDLDSGTYLHSTSVPVPEIFRDEIQDLDSGTYLHSTSMPVPEIFRDVPLIPETARNNIGLAIPDTSPNDQIPDLNNGTYLHPIAMPITPGMTGNNTGPAIPDNAHYEKIGLPDVDNGIYIHPNAMPDMSNTTVKEAYYTRPVMFESARYEKTPGLDKGLYYIHQNTMPDTSETTVKEVYTRPAILDNK